MKIEVACRPGDSTKDKGDLLEGLANDLLAAQNYKVNRPGIAGGYLV